VERVLRRRADEVQAELTVATPFSMEPVEALTPDDAKADEAPLLTERFSGRLLGSAAVVRLPLPGAHQAANLGVAAEALNLLTRTGDLPLNARGVKRGLEAMRWPARVQLIETRPWLIVDCAHNRESARALMQTLRRHLVYDRLIVVIGLSRHKNAEAVAGELAADHAIITRASLERAMPTEELANRTAAIWSEQETVESPGDALPRARELAGPLDLICVTGSFFVIDDLVRDGHLDLAVCGS
jgi:dihydrofolate synthase/folylpolyglutamate synthase